MARGALDPTIGAWYEPSSQTVWSPELKGWVNKAGDVFRQGQSNHWDNLPDPEKDVAIQYAMKVTKVAGKGGGGMAAGPAAPQAQPPQPAAPQPPQPSAIQRIATPAPPSPAAPTDLMAFAKQIGAVR
jgi:hypothetical protein